MDPRTGQVPLASAKIKTEAELLAYARALGAASLPTLHPREQALLTRRLPPIATADVEEIAERIRAGQDPLGDSFGQLRSAEERRSHGATYTPPAIVAEMVLWAAEHAEPDRIVDPGVGSARFLQAAAQRFTRAALVGVDVDPVATLMARATLAAAGARKRSRILLQDYRELKLDPIRGKTLFIGNPPYVRHHLLEPRWKAWLARSAALHGYRASKLAGLHVYFYLATLQIAHKGDFGTFITAAEWLDVNYGKLVRDLFLDGLGGRSLVMVDPAARPFPDAAATAVITTFEIGRRPKKVAVRSIDRLEDLHPLGHGVEVRRERLGAEARWTHLLRASRPLPEGYVELGEVCRVHRGQVTGANKVWIAEEHQRTLPSSVLYRAITRARELFASGGILRDSSKLRHVIDIPPDLDQLPPEQLRLVERFLRWARTRGAHKTYIARHRTAWWSVGLREPPPIMVTYMARRPPIFVLNEAEARYINIAHGVYPREPLSDGAIAALHKHLGSVAADAQGRVYAGGLLKFEPRELERIPVPTTELLEAGVNG